MEHHKHTRTANRSPALTRQAASPLPAFVVDDSGGISDVFMIAAAMTDSGGRYTVASRHGAARLRLVQDTDLFLDEGGALAESAARRRQIRVLAEQRAQCDDAIRFVSDL